MKRGDYTVKHKIIRELRALGDVWRQLTGIAFITAVFGTIIWISCDNISFVWHTSCLPPFTPPMPVMFFIWLLAYALFGALLFLSAHNFCGCSDGGVFYALVSYLASLFWCPSVFFTGGVAAIVALFLSLFCLFLVIRRKAIRTFVVCFCVSIIFIIEIYSLFFTVGFMILN